MLFDLILPEVSFIADLCILHLTFVIVQSDTSLYIPLKITESIMDMMHQDVEEQYQA